MAIEVTRPYVGSIQDHRQVSDGLYSLGDSASKIWNVARWTADRIWNQTGKISDEGTLKAYMKNQSCWKDLNAQSSQKVIEELSDAFQSWFDLRQQDPEANPPGYRKYRDIRPKSTVTFKPGENLQVGSMEVERLVDHPASGYTDRTQLSEDAS